MALMTKNRRGLVIVIAALALAPRAHADEVADWSEAMLRAGLIAGLSAPNMTRPAAMVEAAMFDAVNGIEKRYTPIRVAANGPAGGSRRAAAVQAAYVMLSNLFGSRAVVAPAVPSAAQTAAQATFEARRTVSLLEIAEREGQARINAGTAWGEQVANEIWAWRAGDGFNSPPTPFPDNLTDGKWRRTPNLPVSTSLSAAGAGYILLSNQLPWTMDNPFQFRPGPPPALEHARLLATVTVAMADATIACWDAKYADAFWRPITAIRDEDDGNPLTVPDPAWLPLFATPGHPEYPSGHSCVSGAAAGVLRSEFGNRTRFTVDSDQMIGVTRSFRSFSSALDEVKNARIFAGIHFRTATEVGQQLGETVAEHVMSTRFQRLD
jgi:hypothetical protein